MRARCTECGAMKYDVTELREEYARKVEQWKREGK
jgi:hypothetical protein